MQSMLGKDGDEGEHTVATLIFLKINLAMF